MSRAALHLEARQIRGSLKTPDQSCTDRQVRWVHFSGPPHFGPFATFLVFLLNLGSTAPNYPRRPPMRSNKAPPNQEEEKLRPPEETDVN